jgi:hypothetical protein
MINRETKRIPETRSGFMPETVYSPAYRAFVNQKLIVATGAQEVVFFDDVVHAVEDVQVHHIHGLPGYERCLIPAVSVSETADVASVMQLPPLPQEMETVGQLLARRQNKHQFRVLVPSGNQKGQWLDAFAFYQSSPKGYHQFFLDSRRHLPTDDPDFYLEATNQLLEKGVLGQERALVLPFQTRELHYQSFENWLASGKVVLPDSADWLVSKGRAHEYFTKAGLDKHLPELVWTQTSPETRSLTEENRKAFASQILNALAQMEANGKPGYIKTVDGGVSGVGNLPPASYPQIYNRHLPNEERGGLIYQALFGPEGKLVGSKALPDGAVVEEHLSIQTDDLGRREWVVSGFTVNGQFQPWICSRTLNSPDDIYVGTIASTVPEVIGLTNQEFAERINIVSEFAEAGAKNGYRLGYTAKDLVDTAQYGPQVHDHNDRRGGRSTIEQLLPLVGPKAAFLDRDYEFRIPRETNLAKRTLEIANRLSEAGLLLYGSGSTAFPNEGENGDRLVKFKVLTPLPTDKPITTSGLTRFINQVQQIGES